MSKTTPNHKAAFEAIGTSWTIESDVHMSAEDWQDIIATVRARIDLFDKHYSRFRDDSLVARISKKAGVYELPIDAERLLTFYRQLYDVTEGKVTPLAGDLLVEAGYDANYSLRPSNTLHPVVAWDDTMQYKHPYLTIRHPHTLDFGAAGKGYIVDIIGELLESAGVESFLIDASGDILRKTAGHDTIKIGLGNPMDTEQAIGAARLGNGSICGSAVNRRTWAGLHHIMNPLTAEPVGDIIAAWATAETAMLADGMATALFLTDPAKLQSIFSFEYCIVQRDLTFDHSSGFVAELFTEADNEPH